MSLYKEFFDKNFSDVEREKSPSKKVYDWINRDNLENIIVDGKVFWIELTWSGAECSDYCLNYLKKWMEKKGYTYLYDIPTTI